MIRVRRCFRIAFLAVLCICGLLSVVVVGQSGPGNSPGEIETYGESDGSSRAQVSIAVDSADPNSAEWLGTVPANAKFKKHVTTPSGAAISHSKASSGPSRRLVYSNTLGEFILGPAAGLRVADDITTTAAGGCILDRFVFRVTGDRDNNPNIDEGPFTVDYALFPSCPGAKICQPFESICPRPIGGTSGQITLPDEGFHEVVVTIPDQVCAGGVNDGQVCATQVDCLPTCQGGDFDGAFCSDPLDCPGGGECNMQLIGTCSTGVSLPSSFYFAVTFSRQLAGVVVGAPPLKGVSADRYDSSSFRCQSAFGGFPAQPHASFNLAVYVHDDCPTVFPGYHNSMQGGRPFSPGAFQLFADDITLGVDAGECNMVAYEAVFKGATSSSQGAVQIQLFSRLDDAQPETAGRIPGTRIQGQIFGNDPQIIRSTFSTPIPLGDHIGNSNRLLWAMFKTTSSAVGPIKTCTQAKPGSTLDLYRRYFGPLTPIPSGTWNDVDLGSSCHSGFELTIYCEGDPPSGACCDMYIEENKACIGGIDDGNACVTHRDCGTDSECVGDSVCRDVPEWNCPFPELWEEGARCGPTCEGGDNQDQPCASDADCPGGTCEGSFCVGGTNDSQACRQAADCPDGKCIGGPFAHACGVSACCTYDDQCLDVTKRECFDRNPEERGLLYFRRSFCDSGLVQCPWGACMVREGECSISRPDRGCEDPFCCTNVCDFDSFCCRVAWDELCIVWAQSLCSGLTFDNTCFDADQNEGAVKVEIGESIAVANAGSWSDPSEPDFCCPEDGSLTEGKGKVWFRFEVPQPQNPNDDTVSVEVSTCGSSTLPGLAAADTILQVLSVRDSDRGRCSDGVLCSVTAKDCLDGSECLFDEEAACQTLAPIACNDDAGDSCTGPDRSPEPRHARICLSNLTPGDVYYVMTAAVVPTTRHCEGGANDGAPCTAHSQCGDWCAGGANAREDCGWDLSDCLNPLCDGGDNDGNSCEFSAQCRGGRCECCPGSFCENGQCVDDEHRGAYKFTITSPCDGAVDLIPNDLCDTADQITGASLAIPFDLSGGNGYAPVTFDCPGPGCLSTLENDIWFDWIAPAKGSVEVDTCAGLDETTPDTTMVVYDGCNCPVDVVEEIGCSDFETDGDCFGGSRVQFKVVKDRCYKIRLGGRLGATNVVGDLHVSLDSCPIGTVTFDDPRDGTVDARQPYPPTDPATGQGIQSITVTAPSGVDIEGLPGEAGQFSCWKVCETALDASLVPNGVADVTDNLDGTFTLRLLRPITPEAVTTITYDPGDGTSVFSAVYTSHPGNADGGPVADVSDLTALMDYLTGAAVPMWGLYSTDIDHSGMMTPADLLRLIDILEGAHSLNAAEDTLLPPCGGVCCP